MSLGLSTGIFLDTPTLGSLLASLSASVLTRTSAVTAYPPTVNFTRPIDWQDGDKAVMQWSLDPTFVTGVSETATPQTLTVAVTTYNFGLSAIVSGVYYIRMGAWRGSRGSLNWSNIVGVGDAVAPTIPATRTMADYQFAPGTLALTADKTSAWAIVGGVDMAQFTVSGSTLSSLAQQATKTMTVQVQATSLFGIASIVQTITDTVAANTASAFTFTNVVNAVLTTVYTSNTITVAGIVGAGVTNPISITGAGSYSKNGAAYTTSAGTVVNGDTITLRDTSAAANDITTVTIGATTSTWVVTTNATVSIAKLTIGTGATGAGLYRSQYVSTSDGYTATGTAGPGFIEADKSPDIPPAKFHFETLLSSIGGGGAFYIGACDAALAVGPAVSTVPGNASAGAGVSFSFTPGSTGGAVAGPKCKDALSEC